MRRRLVARVVRAAFRGGAAGDYRVAPYITDRRVLLGRAPDFSGRRAALVQPEIGTREAARLLAEVLLPRMRAERERWLAERLTTAGLRTTFSSETGASL